MNNYKVGKELRLYEINAPHMLCPVGGGGGVKLGTIK